MDDLSIKGVICTTEAGDVGTDEKEVGQRVLKLGAFHNDLGENFKVIYSSRDVNDENVLSFHEAHFFEG